MTRVHLTLLCVLALLLPSGVFSAELEWSSLPPLPESGGVVGAFVTVIDRKLVVAGGLPPPFRFEWREGQPTRSAYVLESPDGAWRETTPLPQGVAFGSAAAFGGYAVFAGGATSPSEQSSSVAYKVSFDGDQIAYQELPALPGPKPYATAAALDGIFYLAGGRNRTGESRRTSEMLRLDTAAADPAWEVAPPVPGPTRGVPAMAAQDGSLYLFGGLELIERPDGSQIATQPLSDSYRFQPRGGWTKIADRPSTVSFGRAIPLGPTHIVMAGGYEGRDPSQAVVGGLASAPTADLYHTVTDTWVSLGEFPAHAPMPGAVEWNGGLAIVGGAVEVQDPLSPAFMGQIASETSGFSSVDYVTLAAYFVVLVMMGIYFAGKGSSTEDFFVAGRRMPWWATGLSIFGTQLSSISFMAIPAKVYATDWVYFLLQMTIVMIAVPVVFLYLPYFRRRKMTSAYEYLEGRFNLPVRLYASVSFVLYQIGRMAIVLFLPAIALSTVTGISVYACILVMGMLSTIYTVMGGMKAVIWTDVVQVFVLYGGALLSLVILVSSMDGGLSGIISSGLEYDKFHMFNWTWDWTTTAVWVVVVGNLFMNLVPYTSDQAVVQRYFTTKDEKAAARSIWTNAILIVPSTLTLFLLGTALWAFYRSHPDLLNPALPTDSIFPLFISQQLPAGIAGLLIAAVFAASMSTLDSSLNSVSAALVTDFFARFRPESSDARRLTLARWLTAGLGILATATSIALATFDIGSLWDTFQGMMGLLGGGLAGLFALGIFFRQANGRGAMTGAVASVLILYWVQQHSDLHFFLYGAVGVLSCVGIGLVASLAWRPSEA